MKIAGIETSTARGSLALVENGRIQARGVIDTQRRHSARLLPLLDSLLKKVEWDPDDLEGIGIGVGPGSFTGIRVGLALARGLAYGLKIPLVGVGSFQALAWSSIRQGGKICVISESRRGRLYAAVYQKRNNSFQELEPPRIILPGEVGGFCREAWIMSPHWDRLRPLLEEATGDKKIIGGENAFPQAESIALITAERLRGKPAPPMEKIKPIYLSDYPRTKR